MKDKLTIKEIKLKNLICKDKMSVIRLKIKYGN